MDASLSWLKQAICAVSFIIFPLLISGFISYLGMEHGMYIHPGPESYCRVSPFITFTCFLCSTLLILSMTFDRFYSIIMPHKAASFNTVKRTNITVVCIAIVSVLYNLPHLFLSTIINWDCIPYATAMGQPYGEFYYLATVLVQFALPFVLILAMNSVIIHKIRHRFVLTEEPSRDRSIKDSNQRETKSSEKQVYVILLLVTFSFLILTTPWYLFFLFIMFVDFSQSPRLLAEYYLFYNIGQKMQYTNHGINFFLYVISGKKFRTDLRNVFPCSNKPKGNRESVVTTVEHLTDV